MKSPISNLNSFHPPVPGVLALASLILLLPAAPLRAAPQDPPPHKISEFFHSSISGGTFNFTRVVTGDPIIDDGSIIYVPIENVAPIAEINRGPSSLTIKFRPDQPHLDIIETTEPRHAMISGWITVGPDQLQVTYNQMTDGKTDFATLQVSDDKKILLPNIEHVTTLDLLKNHPDLVARYFIPLLQKLDLGCLYVRPTDALAVFAPQLPADPKLTQTIAALLPRLDDDSAEIRTQASRDLAALGPRAVPTLQALDPARLPLQTRVAVRTFLQPYSTPDSSRLKDPAFLTLCLALDDPQIPALAKKQLEKITAKPLDFDPAAPLYDRQVAMVKIVAAAMATPHPK